MKPYDVRDVVEAFGAGQVKAAIKINPKIFGTISSLRGQGYSVPSASYSHTATSCFPMETATFFTSTYPSSSHCQLHLGKAYTMCYLHVQCVLSKWDSSQVLPTLWRSSHAPSFTLQLWLVICITCKQWPCPKAFLAWKIRWVVA